MSFLVRHANEAPFTEGGLGLDRCHWLLGTSSRKVGVFGEPMAAFHWPAQDLERLVPEADLRLANRRQGRPAQRPSVTAEDPTDFERKKNCNRLATERNAKRICQTKKNPHHFQCVTETSFVWRSWRGPYRRDDVARVEGDVLDAGAAVVVDVLLDLALALAAGRLVDRHLDRLLVIGDDDRAQRRVLCAAKPIFDFGLTGLSSRPFQVPQSASPRCGVGCRRPTRNGGTAVCRRTTGRSLPFPGPAGCPPRGPQSSVRSPAWIFPQTPLWPLIGFDWVLLALIG